MPLSQSPQRMCHNPSLLVSKMVHDSKQYILVISGREMTSITLLTACKLLSVASCPESRHRTLKLGCLGDLYMLSPVILRFASLMMADEIIYSAASNCYHHQNSNSSKMLYKSHQSLSAFAHFHFHIIPDAPLGMKIIPLSFVY
jgi:hypothetical protein